MHVQMFKAIKTTSIYHSKLKDTPLYEMYVKSRLEKLTYANVIHPSPNYQSV